MLSVTHSINDVKKRLINDYSAFQFNTPEEFEDLITMALENVKMQTLYSTLGKEFYDSIAAKDKGVSGPLTLEEEYIYLGEVYLASSEFLSLNQMRLEGAGGSSESSSESLSVEGYSYSMNKASGTTVGVTGAAKMKYYLGGLEFLANAGYHVLGLSAR